MYIISRKDCQNLFVNKKSSIQDNADNVPRSYKTITVYVHRVIIGKYSKLCLVHREELRVSSENSNWTKNQPTICLTNHFVLSAFFFFLQYAITVSNILFYNIPLLFQWKTYLSAERIQLGLIYLISFKHHNDPTGYIFCVSTFQVGKQKFTILCMKQDKVCDFYSTYYW